MVGVCRERYTLVLAFPSTGQPVRLITIDGELWWVAADVCEVLGPNVTRRWPWSTKMTDRNRKSETLGSSEVFADKRAQSADFTEAGHLLRPGPRPGPYRSAQLKPGLKQGRGATDGSAPGAHTGGMCRSIKTLRPPVMPVVEDEDIRAAALQYVRKVSGFRAPAAHNKDAFDAAVEAVAEATRTLLDELVVRGAPKAEVAS